VALKKRLPCPRKDLKVAHRKPPHSPPKDSMAEIKERTSSRCFVGGSQKTSSLSFKCRGWHSRNSIPVLQKSRLLHSRNSLCPPENSSLALKKRTHCPKEESLVALKKLSPCAPEVENCNQKSASLYSRCRLLHSRNGLPVLENLMVALSEKSLSSRLLEGGTQRTASMSSECTEVGTRESGYLSSRSLRR
jgi:hypothetical protein